MKVAALRGALSDRARHDRVHVVDSLVTGDTPSTKDARALLAGLTDRANLLVVLDRSDLVSLKSVRNLEGIHVLAADQLNTYDVLCADDIVFTRAALEAFVSRAQPVGGVADVQVTTDEVATTTDEAVTTTDDADEKPAKKAAAKKAPAKTAAKKSTATEATEAEQAQEETK
jgi:large subunit ribosomal protein L4